MKPTNILVDTNVLVNDFFSRKGNETDRKRFSKMSAKATMSLNRLSKNNLYVASFSVIQLVSLLQKHKYPFRSVAHELGYLLAKYHIISIDEKDLKLCVDYIHKLENIDIEDNLIYLLSNKAKCAYILTYNAKDFSSYLNKRIINPGKFMMLYD